MLLVIRAESLDNHHERLVTPLMLNVNEKVHTDSGYALQSRKCKLIVIAEHSIDMNTHSYGSPLAIHSFYVRANALVINFMCMSVCVHKRRNSGYQIS